MVTYHRLVLGEYPTAKDTEGVESVWTMPITIIDAERIRPGDQLSGFWLGSVTVTYVGRHGVTIQYPDGTERGVLWTALWKRDP